ncbi:MAG: hypothetical protein EBU08_06290 [Micrococcales bacterium]|nr:hypothetical protein [Micrococcales bacterium]
MALPASLSTVTVAGTYVDLLGNPVRGSITIEPQTILKEKTLNVHIMPVHIVKTLDATGSFTTTLPVTSDTDVTPQPFVYTIVENFTSGRTFQIALPLSVAGTTQNLADLLTALSEADATAYVSVDAYQGLLTRYNNASGRREIVVNASTYESNALAYATEASNSASAVANFTTNQLMMMGV